MSPQTDGGMKVRENTVMYLARRHRGEAGHHHRQAVIGERGNRTGPDPKWAGMWSPDGVGSGRSPRSSPRSGKPATWRRGAADTRLFWSEEDDVE